MDLIAIKRTQGGPGAKLKLKFLRLCRTINHKGGNTHDRIKEGYHEEHMHKSTCADYRDR